jgi:hypothetical protein
MISPASFNFYQELLEDVQLVTGSKPFTEEWLASTMNILVEVSKTQQEE